MLPTISESTRLHRLTLPQPAKLAWLADVSQMRFPDPCDAQNWRSFADAGVEAAGRHLTGDLREALAEFFSLGGPDALVIENLPVDRKLPAAPDDGRRPTGKTAVSEAVIAGLIESHASIISYTNEKAGAPIHEITPVAGQEHVSSSAGRAPFACHTDVAFLAPCFNPQGLLLFGLRNQAGAPTAVLPLDLILEAASPALLKTLEKPVFLHPAPSSFELKAAVTGPILRWDAAGNARIAVQTHAVQPVNDEACAAIQELRALLDSLEAMRVVLGPGDALIFRNDRVLHGRDAFVGERWLQRAYFTDSLDRFRERTHTAAPEFVFDARVLAG
jgi:hypothetical protein